MRDESPLSATSRAKPSTPLTPRLTPGSPLLCYFSPHTLTCPSYATAPGHVCTPPVRTLALPLPLLPPRAHVRARPIWYVELRPPPLLPTFQEPHHHHRSQPAQLRPTIAPPHHYNHAPPMPDSGKAHYPWAFTRVPSSHLRCYVAPFSSLFIMFVTLFVHKIKYIVLDRNCGIRRWISMRLV